MNRSTPPRVLAALLLLPLLAAATPAAELETYVDALKRCTGLGDRACLLATTRLQADSDAALPLLGAQLSEMNRSGQLFALSVIDSSQSKAATELLMVIAADKRVTETTRALAIDDLGTRSHPQLVDMLLRARRDSDTIVRVAATRTLANRLYKGDTKSLAALRESSRDREASVRLEAIFGLAFSHDPAVGGDLVQALSDLEPAVRRAAAEGLAVIKHAAAASHLVAQLRDGDPMLVRAALRALRFQTGLELPDDPAEWERWQRAR